MSLQWIHAYVNKGIPPNPVFAGNDSDGTPMFIGRAMYNGESCVAKVIASKNLAFISHGGREIPMTEYDVLTGLGLKWEACKNGQTPIGAVECGHTAKGEAVYVGRTHFAGSLTPGKVIKSHSCLYFPFGGHENKSLQYEVLVNIPKVEWKISSSNDPAPVGAHIGGNDADGSPIYVGRAYHDSFKHAAKVIPSKHIAYISHNGMEIPKHSFEVLCNGTVQWIPYSPRNGIPPKAVPVGPNNNNEISYIGRSPYMGSITVGKFIPSHNALYIPFNGSEVVLHQFDVLCEY